MLITKESFVRGLSDFATQDLIPVMPNGLEKLAALMLNEAFKKNPDLFLAPYWPMMDTLGVLNEDKTMVDKDLLGEYLGNAMALMNELKFKGFTINRDDALKLIGRMR